MVVMGQAGGSEERRRSANQIRKNNPRAFAAQSAAVADHQTRGRCLAKGRADANSRFRGQELETIAALDTREQAGSHNAVRASDSGRGYRRILDARIDG